MGVTGGYKFRKPDRVPDFGRKKELEHIWAR
jgi:hypothetical protein